jgi:hypothetical protein
MLTSQKLYSSTVTKYIYFVTWHHWGLGIEVKIWERGANLGPGHKIMLSLAKLKLLPDGKVL